MRVAVFQRLGALSLCTLLPQVVQQSAAAETEIFLADVNVRYHVLPGVSLGHSRSEPVRTELRAKALTLPKASASVSVQKKVSWESSCEEPVRVSFFGDFWVPPHGAAAGLKQGIFDHLQPLLNWADFNVVNFEGNITTSNKREFPKFPFGLKQASDSAQWLTAAGVKHFTRANNHSMDFGWKGAQDTSAAIKKAGGHYAGIGPNLNAALQPMWMEKNGTKIAVFSLTTTYPAEAWAASKRAGVAFPAASTVKEIITQVRKQADFIVVVFHWGDELKPSIKPHQEEYAKMVLKAGADFVVGHHAHVAQKIDSDYADGTIVYGVGNFLFSSLSRDAKFALGTHAEFCTSRQPDETGATHTYRLVFTPLMTHNRSTGYKSRPMSLSEFLPYARQYLKERHFSSDLEFFLPGENQVRTLSEWLQPRSQASKEGRAVN